MHSGTDPCPWRADASPSQPCPWRADATQQPPCPSSKCPSLKQLVHMRGAPLPLLADYHSASRPQSAVIYASGAGTEVATSRHHHKRSGGLPFTPQPAPPRLWTSVAARFIINVAAHPFACVRTLVQLGHEPIPAHATRTVLGAPAKGLPNVFQYVWHIKSTKGLGACYAGLPASICSMTLSAIVFSKVANSLTSTEAAEAAVPATPPDRRAIYFRRVGTELVARVLAIAVSHPFHVAAVRAMAQAAGEGDVKYAGLMGSLVAVYKDSGPMGFFQGLVPRALGEVVAVLAASTITLLLSQYAVDDREARGFVSASSTYVGAIAAYPFNMVATCMAVQGTSLAAAQAPHLPATAAATTDANWVDVLRGLANRGQLMRGANVLWRHVSPDDRALLSIASTREVPIPKPISGLKKFKLFSSAN